MRVLISDVIRKTAIDFSVLRKIPGFLKNPIEAAKKYIVDLILEDPEKNLMPVLNFKPGASAKTALVPYPKGTPRPKKKKKIMDTKTILGLTAVVALTFLLQIFGPGFVKDIEKDVQSKINDKKIIQTIKTNYAETQKAIEGEF